MQVSTAERAQDSPALRPRGLSAECEPERSRLTIAYLVNTYPMASQTFIRREIAGLESLGVEVHRYAIRRWDSTLVDPRDEAELRKTRFLLDAGPLRLLVALLATLTSRPRRFVRAVKAAWGLSLPFDQPRLARIAYLAEACLLRRWLQRSHCTHVHAHFATNSAAVAMLCRHLGGPSYSFTAHGECDLQPNLTLDEKIRHAAFVVTISSFSRSQLYRFSDYANWGKVEIVRCGLDAEEFEEPEPIGHGPARLLCIGRLSEEKGQLVLIDAVAQLARKGIEVELAFAGDGPMRAIIERRIAEARMEARIQLLGWLTGREIRQQLLRCHALVLPSFVEGLPIVIMEALAAGRPVVSTYVAGIPELVVPGENGWLVPAGDVDALGDAIEQVTQTPPDELNAMGRRGRRRTLALHHSQRQAQQLLALFEEVSK